MKEGQDRHVSKRSFLTSALTLPKRTAWPVALEKPVIISPGVALTLVACSTFPVRLADITLVSFSFLFLGQAETGP